MPFISGSDVRDFVKALRTHGENTRADMLASYLEDDSKDDPQATVLARTIAERDRLRDRFHAVMAALDTTGEGVDADTFVDGHADAEARAKAVVAAHDRALRDVADLKAKLDAAPRTTLRSRVDALEERDQNNYELITAHDDMIKGLCRHLGLAYPPNRAQPRMSTDPIIPPAASAPKAPAPVRAPTGTPGVYLVLEERDRQIHVEGWSLDHDLEHSDGTLEMAAACYALYGFKTDIVANWWPWDSDWFKPSNKIRNLTKAGALITAAIDREMHKQAKGLG